MKKYWKLLILTLFTISALSVFYYEYTKIAKFFPQLSFETIEGKEELIDNVTVHGDYYSSFFRMEPFKVTKKGTNYLRDERYTDRTTGVYKLQEIAQLESRYRSFMRGKETDPQSFYVTDTVVGYGATPYNLWSFDNYYFEVGYLDKTTNEAVTFTAPIPNRTNYWSVEPHYVYATDKEVTIITENDVIAKGVEDEYIEIYKYTFDTETEQLIDHARIVQLKQRYSDDTYEFIDIINSDTFPEQFLIVKSTYESTEHPKKVDAWVEKHRESEVIKYNIATKEAEEISLENANSLLPVAFDEDNLYGTRINGKSFHLIQFDMEEKSVLKEMVHELNIPVAILDDFAQSDVKNNTLYYLFTENDATLVAFDLTTLDVAYVGKLTQQNLLIEKIDSEYYLYDLEIID